MKKDIRYYRVTLCNPYEENGLNQDAIVVVFDIDGRGLLYEGRELLTNKKMFMCDMFHYGLREEVALKSITNQKCELAGGNFEEVNEEFVLKFLKFTPKVDIDNMINNIKNIEESIKNYTINNQNKIIKK